MKCCVYTVLLGRYEKLNEQPVASRSGLPFICLTDDASLKSASWNCRLIKPLFPEDPVRSQRDLKIRPHIHMSEYDCSIYIDNSVILKEPPERLLEMLSPETGFLLPHHSFRETVLDEFLEVARLGLDDSIRIFEQLNHYAVSVPDVLAQRPLWTAILVRDHRSQRVRSMLEIWASHVMRYSRRDQLSINVALIAASLDPTVWAIDNYGSDLHIWPFAEGRDQQRGARSAHVSFMPNVARLRFLEQERDVLSSKIPPLEAEVAQLRAEAAELKARGEAEVARILDKVERRRLKNRLRRLGRKILRSGQKATDDFAEPIWGSPQSLAHLSDAKWLSMLRQSAKSNVIDGITLPGFPEDDIQINSVGSAGETTIGEAFKFYLFIKDQAEKVGQPINPETKILDFGAGWGRTIRCFWRDADPSNIHGVDTSERFLTAGRKSGIGNLRTISPMGSLPYPDQSFDIVYAYSVFTHLPKHVQDIWLPEIARVLRPGGLFVPTVEPRRFYDFVKGLNNEMKAKHVWYRNLSEALVKISDAGEQLDKEGFLFLPTNGIDTYGDTVMTPEYIEANWTKSFRILGYLDDPERFFQAVVSAQKN